METIGKQFYRGMKIKWPFLLLCSGIVMYCVYLDVASENYRTMRYANYLTVRLTGNTSQVIPSLNNTEADTATAVKGLHYPKVPQPRWFDVNSTIAGSVYINHADVTSTGNSIITKPATINKVSVNHADVQPNCKPHETVVFLKTHKTGSSTLTTTLERYGYKRNLSIAIPKRNLHIISSGYFNPSQVYPGKFDMLVNHVRFKKSEMQKVMKPNAKYFTIIRDPRTQIESVFGYFLLFKGFRLPEENAFKTFISRPQYYWDRYPSFAMRNHLKNPNLYDLGLETRDQENTVLVDKAIKRIASEFDLVLIQEYYNESLLLLKKLLCFSFEDILYIPKGVRSSKRRYTLSGALRESINKWSWADAKLYAHFNKTFWERVKEYGPTFQEDLKYFEYRLEETRKNCTIENATKDNSAHRESFLVLHPKADKSCLLMMKSDPDMTKLIRVKQYGNISRRIYNKSKSVVGKVKSRISIPDRRKISIPNRRRISMSVRRRMHTLKTQFKET
ncbi:galactose-3-O-sulfotransferase 2-like [Anneissia japonica]|uniref:galactose-3-O-sulfotransferase 2-like n=1 Tax=Anneissia japonica TaxID=1529436 RepID=UPI001425B885|nr:galactose-3-O-sulfotransferase 2-like [Anneissia japonica]